MKNINIKNIFKFVVSITLILFLAFKIDFAKVDFKNPFLLITVILSIIITLLSLLLMTKRWSLLIKKFLAKDIILLQLYRFYIIGMFFNIFLPGAIGGDVVRTQRLIKNYNVAIKPASIITLSERVLGIYSLLILLMVGVLFKNFPPDIPFFSSAPLYLFLAALVFVLLLAPIAKYFFAKKQINLSYDFLWHTLALSLLAQFGDIVIAYLFSLSFNIQLPFAAFMFIMPLVYIATVIPISLGGLGIREASFAGLMTLYGVDVTIAISISFLMYIVKVLVGVIGYVVYLKEK